MKIKAICLVFAMLIILAGCKKDTNETLFYPENLYDTDAEHFVNRENDRYIDYILRIAAATWEYSGIPYGEDYAFNSETELSSEQLINLFFVATENICENYECEDGAYYMIPVSDIYTILDKYFSEYELDIHDVSYNFEYLENDTLIKSPGFIGLTPPFYFGYYIDSVVDNGDGTVKIIAFENGAEMVNDDIVPTGKIGAIHTMVIEPAENSCLLLSYEIDWIDN